MPASRLASADGAALDIIVAAPSEIALFLDVDGTLLHLAERPDAVTIDAGTLTLLERAYAATQGALALITGRALADVDRLFAPLVLPVAGQHGFERRDAHGRLHLHARPGPQLAHARARLACFAAGRPGVLVEDKGLSVAAHFRSAPDAEDAIGTLAGTIAAESEGALAIQRGKMVVELKPAGKDKGTAIAEFMAERPFLGREPVFVGDDLTDEYGFSIVNGLGGISVKVGDGPTEASIRLPGVDEVRRWLERLTVRATEQDA